MPSMAVFTAHGGNSTEGRMMVNGVPVAGSFSGNSVAQFGYDIPMPRSCRCWYPAASANPRPAVRSPT